MLTSSMTKTIVQVGEPFSAYGVQFWSSDKGAVKKALDGIYRVVDDAKPANYTIRLRDEQVDDHSISQMSFGAALEAMKCGKTVTRPCFEGVFDGILLSDQSIMFVKGVIPAQFYTPTCEDVLAMDWQICEK